MRLAGEPDLVGQAINLLPKCYTYGLARCIELSDRTAHPNCSAFLAAYDEDADRFDAVIEQLPVCPLPKIQPWHFYAVSAAAVALGIGCIVLARR